ncbi:MAG: type II secretion system protein [bacterium]|nr:type II secretion system protein [bacterium]
MVKKLNGRKIPKGGTGAVQFIPKINRSEYIFSSRTGFLKEMPMSLVDNREWLFNRRNKIMSYMIKTSKKGFTLIELLIVIGILAILATAVILILNPVELFKQARDSQRISDMATMKSALAFYLSTVSGANLGAAGTCYAYAPAGGVALPADCGLRHTASAEVYDADLSVDGTGWMPIDLGQIPGGAPLSALPRDPQASAGKFYSYVGNTAGGTFEMNADMESGRYSCGGKDDVESTDGGDKPIAGGACDASSVYEVGNDPGLNL